MSFDLLDKPLIYIPVKWPGLKADDNGDAVAVEHTVDVQIELLDVDLLNEWLAASDKIAADADTAARRIHDRETFKTVAKNWRGVSSNGKNVPFTDDNIDRMLQVPNFASGFGVAYRNAWSGQAELREGNSAGSPANGPAVEPSDATPKDATSKSNPPQN